MKRIGYICLLLALSLLVFYLVAPSGHHTADTNAGVSPNNKNQVLENQVKELEHEMDHRRNNLYLMGAIVVLTGAGIVLLKRSRVP